MWYVDTLCKINSTHREIVLVSFLSRIIKVESEIVEII